MARKPATRVSHDTTAAELREQLDISVSSLKRYLKDGLPHVGDGKDRRFNLGECVAWMKSRNLTGEPGRPAEPAGEELQRLRCLKERALIRKYERESALAERRLLDIGDVIEKYKQLAIEVRKRMHQLPMRILNLPGLNMSNAEKGLADRAICEMCDDVIRMVGEAMAEHTTPFEAMTLDKKPMESELDNG